MVEQPMRQSALADGTWRIRGGQPAACPSVRSGRAGGRPPRRAWRRLRSAVVVSGLIVLVVAVTLFALLLAMTPSAEDASDRVVQRARLSDSALLPADRPLPDKVLRSLLAVEDSRFYSHLGVDGRGAVRALWGYVQQDGPDSGGSTLDQQLAKNLYTDGRQDVEAKVVQVALAFKLDFRYSKDEIVRMYLNTVDFGHGYRGVLDASRGYFGAEPQELDWSRAALLVGLVQAPSAYDPTVKPDLALQRRNHVLDRLVATGVLTEREAALHAGRPVGLGGEA